LKNRRRIISKKFFLSAL